jgi:hypothetical protein
MHDFNSLVLCRPKMSMRMLGNRSFGVYRLVAGPHNVYGFLTTSANTVVEPIHPKAVSLILTTDDERDMWMRASWDEEGAAAAIGGRRVQDRDALADKEDRAAAA